MAEQKEFEMAGAASAAGDGGWVLQAGDLAGADLMRQFEAALARVRYELLKGLAEIDPLQGDRLRQVLDLFGQRLVLFQHEFLEGLARARGASEEDARRYCCGDVTFDPRPEAAAGVGAGLLAMLALGVPAGVKGMLWWKTTVSLAVVIASALGIPAWLVVPLLTGGGGVVGFFGLRKALAPKRRQRVQQAVVGWFDGEAAPALRAWAGEKIRGAA